MTPEQERIRRIMENVNKEGMLGEKLSISPTGELSTRSTPSDNSIQVGREDLGFSR